MDSSEEASYDNRDTRFSAFSLGYASVGCIILYICISLHLLFFFPSTIFDYIYFSQHVHREALALHAKPTHRPTSRSPIARRLSAISTFFRYVTPPIKPAEIAR